MQALITYIKTLLFTATYNTMIFGIIISIMGTYFRINLKKLPYAHKQNMSLFLFSCFFVLQFSISIYFILNKLILFFPSLYKTSILFTSGLLMIAWLVITGFLIKKLYNWLIHNLNYKKGLQDNSEILFIISSMGILCSLTAFPYEKELSCTILAIIISRFYWIDTGMHDFKDILPQLKSQISDLFKFKTHPSLANLTTYCVISYIISWGISYSIYYFNPNSPISQMYPIITGLVSTLLLKPILNYK